MTDSDSWSFLILVFLSAVLLAFSLARSWEPERCPRCHTRGFLWIGGCRYRRQDVWGCRGGSYRIHNCIECGLYRVHHRKGWDDLPNENWAEAADNIVFGREGTDTNI